MRKLKRFISLVAAFCMFAVSAYAETKDVTYKVTVDGENVSVVEDSLSSDKDYSDFYVNVIKDTNGQQTTIYSGALGGYADGKLLLKSKRENVSLTSNSPSLYLSSDFNCRDGSYIVISAYERRKFTKLISKCTVKPVTFDFTAFN